MNSEKHIEGFFTNTLSRRRFLTRSAIAVASAPLAGGLVVPAIRAAGVGANDKIRVGLIGAGLKGRGDLDTFLQNAEVDFPVICDVDDANIARAAEFLEKRRGKKPDGVKDFRRVLDRADVDVVLIATPDHWHALPTVLACQAGKDVYVEKPLATSIAEGRAMLIAAQKHQRVVQMGTQWRSGKHWAEAVEFVRSGKLGTVGLARGWAYHDWLGNIGAPPDCDPPAGVDYDMWLGPAPKRPFNPNRFHFNFRWFWDYAGGAMTDWGVHLINIMLWAMGPEPPKTVSSTGGKFVFKDNSETPDTQVTVYEFPTYSMVWEHKLGGSVGVNGRSWGVSFSGNHATLILDDKGWEVIAERKQKTIESKVYPPGGEDPRRTHVRNFLDCLKSRQAPVENLEVGHFVSSVAHLGNIALRCGRDITWDAKAEKIVGDPNADRLLSVEYRQPWKLPYYQV
ncbi:MAG: Gfo/Idh/MocA family oxidoreductase [Candidatus Sumerlaeota bacterium]|nr:Gfo/Idh/MocA family oxidoreductase [Candidatus Sumerlaeota bacterium]